MKKTFKLTHEKIKIPRLFEAVKYDVRKYIKRERGKDLPEGADFWDFDCRFGIDEENSHVIHVSEINKSITWAETEQLESLYLEILAKPCQRKKTPKAESSKPVDD